MKDDGSVRKFLLFLLLSAAVICAAVFFFHVSDKPEKTRTVTIVPRNEDTSAEPDSTVTAKTTSKAKTTVRTTKVTTRTVKTTAAATAEEFVMLDINSASAEELTKLKGVGETLANEIINYRETSGKFKNIEEIMKVRGIGESIFNDIRDHIYVVDPVYDEPEETDAGNENNTNEEEHSPSLEELAPIDINTAEKDILLLLPNVDEDIADRIIEFRERTGGFQSEYELLLIEGLSRSDVSEIMDYINI